MIGNGLAYIDDTNQEQMQKERMERQNLKHRDQSPSEALKYFQLMCSVKEEGKVCCLLAKIDMTWYVEGSCVVSTKCNSTSQEWHQV